MSDLLLRQAKESDSKILFDLRNHPKIRRLSHNTSSISLAEHQVWFRKVLIDNSKKVMIAQREDDFIGMVRFELIDNAYLMSWAIFPEFQGHGFGKKMVDAASKTVNGTLKAEIKQNNHISIRIAEHIGMKLTKTIGNTLFYQR